MFIDRNQIHQTSQAGPCSHERILISLTQVPFSEFLSSTGEMSLPGFFRCHSGILTLDTEEQVLAECLLTMRLKNFMKKRLDLGIWPCQICPGFSFLPKGMSVLLLYLLVLPCLPNPNTER